MAEGLLGGIVGGGEERQDAEVTETRVGADAFAAAVVHGASFQDREVAKKTAIFLDHQSRLLETQREHLQDEHALRLSSLRGQRMTIYIRVAFQVFVALVATVIGIVFAVMLRDALTSHSVIVEAFEAPPALAARGVTGTVVAGSFLDELTRLRNATRTSAAAKRNLSSAWSNEVKVSVPDAGISLGELSRLLKARFGHDLRIGGDLVETRAGGLALTVRGDGVQARVFTGTTDELDKLIISAAQYVYAESQPVLWAIYLEGVGRHEEELAFIKSIYGAANPADRPYLLNSWANVTLITGGSGRDVLKMYQSAIKLKPDYWVAYANVQHVLVALADEEGAWRAGEDLRRAAGGRPGSANERYFASWDELTRNLLVYLNAEISDSDASGGFGTSHFSAATTMMQIEVYLHDPDAAELRLQTINHNENNPTVVTGTRFARALLSMESGDAVAAATEMEAFGDLLADPAVRDGYADGRCWIALAEEAAGRPDKADANLKIGGTFVNCYRFRGDILDGRGDWTGAQKAYADAVALAPDLPAGYYSWGVALARHGDLAGAEAKLKDANRRGPHWADPLKAWGDMLNNQGHLHEALAKYDEALKYAPNWVALKQARDAASKHTS
jgi:tetratricopeptide (TPR) repeat protein